LSGPSVNGTNNVGMFLANDQVLDVVNNPHQTETALLARLGDSLQVAPGVTKVISALNFFSTTGNGSNSINDLGQLSAQVTFTDNTQGVYVFTPDLRLRPNAPTTISSWNNATNWKFGFNPNDQIYKVVIDPTDITLPTPAPVVTVTGPTVDRAVASLQVGGVTGTAHLVLQGGVTLTLGVGANLTTATPTSLRVDGIPSAAEVLTIRGPSDITVTGAGATLKIKGDVRSLAGSGTAVIG